MKRAMFGLFGFSLSAGTVFAGAFSAGDLVIDQVGTGISPLSSAATQTSLVEYTTAGGLIQQIFLPTSASGNNNILTNSGTATSEGALALSSDGRYLTLAGYNAALGTSSVASTSTIGAGAVSRVVGLVDASGNVNTSTQITDGYSGNNIRGAVTGDDGKTFYTSGTSGTTGGTRDVSAGSTGASTQISTTVTNTRVVEIANGQLYTSSGSGSNIGINAVGTGLPTTSGQTTSLVTSGTPTADVSPYGFVFLGNNLYVVDSSAGLLKYTLSGSSYNYVSTTTGPGTLTGFTGLTGKIGANGHDILYATDPTSLVSFDDNNQGTITSALLATAAANTAFRGVAFAPTAQVSAVPEPASIAMTSLGLLGMAGFALRRKVGRVS